MMYREDIAGQLEGMIKDRLKARGIELVELLLRQEAGNLVLRILADRSEGGITLEECARINRDIASLLDEKGTLGMGYTLEVSSPGLDRPLKTKADFARCLNRKARFFLNQPLEGKVEIEGGITRVDDNAVSLESEGRVIEIPLSMINRAKQVIANI